MSELRASLSIDGTEPFMSIPETVLIYVGAPALIMIVIALAAIGPSEMKAPSRYRPGRPWPHQPSWFLPHPAATAVDGAHGGPAELTGGHAPAAILDAPKTYAAGGASGEW
jgi:hypothetical protein